MAQALASWRSGGCSQRQSVPKLPQASASLGLPAARAAFMPAGHIALGLDMGAFEPQAGRTRRAFAHGRSRPASMNVGRCFDMGAHHVTRLRHIAHLEHLLVPQAGVQVEDAQLGQGAAAHRGRVPAGPCGEREARERAREADGNPHTWHAAGGERLRPSTRDRK